MRRLLALAGVVAWSLACGDGARPGNASEVVLYRLVDPAIRLGAKVTPTSLVVERAAREPVPGSTQAIPELTIGDDTRFVLAAYPKIRLLPLRAVAASDGGRVTVRAPVGLPGHDELIVNATLRWANGGRLNVPPRRLPVDDEQGDDGVLIEVQDDALAGASDLRMSARGWIATGSETRYRTPEISIPAGAALHFATGIGDPHVGEGIARFRLSVCEAEACEVLFEEERTFPRGKMPGWKEAQVDLPVRVSASLHFETTYDGTAGAFALPAWGNPTVRVSSASEAVGPSLILISLDTLRADHLGLYGYQRKTSPFMDRLFGGEGAVFERFVAAATTTGPSHMSIMTSLPPSQHGALSGLHALAAPVPTLAETLRERGFTTAAFTENGRLERRRGFGRGFDRYVENKSADLLNPVGDVETTFAQARSWLEQNGRSRTFLFLHTYQVHAPYQPPPGYAHYFVDDGVTGAHPKAQRRLDQYDREIRYVDDQVGELVAWLRGRERLDHTLLVITSDHGEEFLEHGGIGHRSLPHEELAHVPLLMRGPGIPSGRRVASVAGHIDLLPTLLELLGVPTPSHARGRSLAAGLAASAGESDDHPVFTEAWVIWPPYQVPGFAVRVGDEKLIAYRSRNGSGVRLYDLSRDPQEKGNLATRPAGRKRAAEMKALLQRHLEASRAAGEVVEVEPEVEEKLRVLGYAE